MEKFGFCIAHGLWLRVLRQAPMFFSCLDFMKPHLGPLSAQENNLGQRARGLFRWVLGEHALQRTAKHKHIQT